MVYTFNSITVTAKLLQILSCISHHRLVIYEQNSNTVGAFCDACRDPNVWGRWTSKMGEGCPDAFLCRACFFETNKLTDVVPNIAENINDGVSFIGIERMHA